jgi:hypothetical protein
MSIREKARWVALFADLLIWAWYFNRVADVLPAGPADEMAFLWLAVRATIASVVVHVVAAIVLAVGAPAEAAAGPDEREQAIERASGARAYGLLGVALVTIFMSSWFGWTKFMLVNAILLAFLLAELARNLTEIRAFRTAAA